MSTRRERLELLQDALEKAIAEPIVDNVRAVGFASEGITLGADDDSSDEDDHLEVRCYALARQLGRQLGIKFGTSLPAATTRSARRGGL